MRARGRLIVAAGAVLVACSSRLASAQTAPAIHLELGNWDLRRHVEIVAAGADVVHAATEAGLGKIFEAAATSRDGRGRMLRVAKLYLVDLPTVAVAHTLGHEYGHTSRSREYNISSPGFSLENWPWPVPFVNGRPKPGGSFAGSFDPPMLGIASGGYEAGRVRDKRFADDFSNPDGIDQFSATRLIYSRLEEPLAATWFLRDSAIHDQDFFLEGNSTGGIQDPVVYAAAFTSVKYGGRISTLDAQTAARQIRRGARWALLDLELAGSFYRVANYLWTGRAVGQVPALAFAGNRIWPRATFALTSAGIARGGEALWVRERFSVKGHAEKTEQAMPLDTVGFTDRGRPILADHTRSLWGGGLAATTSIGATRLSAEGNYWNQDTTGRGGSGEARAERRITAWPTRPSVSLAIGYKTAGFLAGAPDAARWFVSAGLTFRPNF